MTATRCIAACNELGYGWAGLQNRERESRHLPDNHKLTWQNAGARNQTQGRTLRQSQRSTTAPSLATATPMSDVEDGAMSICIARPLAALQPTTGPTTEYQQSLVTRAVSTDLSP